MNLCEPNSCLGCGACINTCAHHAIEMRPNQYGALLPVIDQDACVDCGLCRQVCPVINKTQKPNKADKCYAAWTTNGSLIENAASAGVVTALGQHVIKNDGAVFGTLFQNKQLTFTCATTLDELMKFQGSRYVQAYVGNAFQLVKQRLNNGQKVMFTGTPCQVHGLRQYLGKEYENLLTVDLVCHGVSSNIMLNEYLAAHGIDNYDNLVFRGNSGMSLVVTCQDRVVYKKYKVLDLFYTTYLRGIISRENCYTCPYASLERYGDITVGDFWGLEKTPDLPNIPFISSLFVNTPKGKRYLDDCSDSISCVERPVEMATKKNRQLSHPCDRHQDRDTFLALYPRLGFIRSIKKTRFYWNDFFKKSTHHRILLIASKLKHSIYGKRF